MTGRDDLRAVIREVLSEQDRQHGYIPRAPFQRFADPEGKPWYSATVSRVQALSAVLALLTTIFGAIWFSMATRDQIVVLPLVDQRIKSYAVEHDKQALERFATKAEAAALREVIAVSTAERVEQFNAIQRQLDRIERELVRRK